MIKTCRLFSVLVMLSGVALADSNPPPSFPISNHDAPSATLKSAPVKSISLGRYVVEFEKALLSEVVQRLGIGAIGQHGDASESAYWACYSVSQSGIESQLWLLSGEGGGANHVIHGVVAKRVEKDSSNSCPELPKEFQPVHLDHGIWLETPRGQIEKILGRPSLKANGWDHYASESPAKDGWREMGLLSVKDGKELWATISYGD